MNHKRAGKNEWRSVVLRVDENNRMNDMDTEIIIALVGVGLALLGVVINLIWLISIQKQINMEDLINAPSLKPDPGPIAGDANSGILWEFMNKGGRGEIIQIENFKRYKAGLGGRVERMAVYKDEVVMIILHANEHSRSSGKMFPKFKIHYRTPSGKRYCQIFEMSDDQLLVGSMTKREKKRIFKRSTIS